MSSVYKYLPFSVNTLKLLINGEFYFGLPKNLNDPFEGEFLTKTYRTLPSNNLLRFIYEKTPEILAGKSIDEKLAEIKADFNIFHINMHEILKTRLKVYYGVTCFTYSKTDILMWAHYANSHQGLCLIFDKEKLYNTLCYPKDWFVLKDIQYTSNLIEGELIISETNFSFKNEKEILYTKLKHWKREKELRLIAFFSNSQTHRYISFDKTALTGVIFGENILIENKETIKRLITNDKEFGKVKYYKSSKDFINGKMKITLD